MGNVGLVRLSDFIGGTVRASAVEIAAAKVTGFVVAATLADHGGPEDPAGRRLPTGRGQVRDSGAAGQAIGLG